MAEEKLSAAQRSKIRRLSAPKELAPDEEGGELNIVPFLDIVTNVLMFVLATVSVTFTATIDTFPPRAGGGGRGASQQQNTLGLTVLVVPDGFSLKARGGNVAPGCESVGEGLAVPKKNNEYDFKTLAKCAKRLKGASPDFEDETSVTISANKEIPYKAVIGVMDALRTDPDTAPDAKEKKEMFPDVQFGLVK